MPPPTGSDFGGSGTRVAGNRLEGEVAPNSAVGVSGGGGTVSVEEASGHFYAGFGEGLTTKSPVLYFVKTKHNGGSDCKAPIDPYKARKLSEYFFLRRYCFPPLRKGCVFVELSEFTDIVSLFGQGGVSRACAV